jgi:hypothetical protein
MRAQVAPACCVRRWQLNRATRAAFFGEHCASIQQLFPTIAHGLSPLKSTQMRLRPMNSADASWLLLLFLGQSLPSSLY